MYKKLLIISCLGLALSACAGGVSNNCSSQFDQVRTAQEDFDCIVQLRDENQALLAELGVDPEESGNGEEVKNGDDVKMATVVQPAYSMVAQPVNPNIVYSYRQPVNPNIYLKPVYYSIYR